ncbi:MAG: antiviral reverse transcriptase Drt3a, partial [Endomicrobiaceae bacterium]
MLDQFFSVESLKKIFDYENRRGCYLKSILTTDINQLTEEIKLSIKNLKQYKSKNPTKKKEIQELYKCKYELIDKKNNLIKTELQKISDKILSDNFSITLTRNNFNPLKPIYSTNKNLPEVFFALKQMQNILKKTYKVKQSNRNQILSQFKNVIESTYPKYIMRTDIKSFYESIDRDRLLGKINREQLLTLDIKKMIHKICEEYGRLSGNNKGVPRGIGVSPYLVEIYMKDLDNFMKHNKNVIFYARYVDDIIIVSTLKSIDKIFEKEIIKLKLSINKAKDKTKKFYVNSKDIKVKNKEYEIKYLGYKICIKNNNIVFKLSDDRIT